MNMVPRWLGWTQTSVPGDPFTQLGPPHVSDRPRLLLRTLAIGWGSSPPRKGRRCCFYRSASRLSSQPGDHTGNAAGGSVNVFQVRERDQRPVLRGGTSSTGSKRSERTGRQGPPFSGMLHGSVLRRSAIRWAQEGHWRSGQRRDSEA